MSCPTRSLSEKQNSNVKSLFLVFYLVSVTVSIPLPGHDVEKVMFFCQFSQKKSLILDSFGSLGNFITQQQPWRAIRHWNGSVTACLQLVWLHLFLVKTRLKPHEASPKLSLQDQPVISERTCPSARHLEKLLSSLGLWESRSQFVMSLMHSDRTRTWQFMTFRRSWLL